MVVNGPLLVKLALFDGMNCNLVSAAKNKASLTSFVNLRGPAGCSSPEDGLKNA